MYGLMNIKNGQFYDVRSHEHKKWTILSLPLLLLFNSIKVFPRSLVSIAKVKIILLHYVTFGGMDRPKEHRRWTANIEGC
jgi:hypothetical protein